MEWRKSTKCASNACVEVATDINTFLVRDAKDSASPILKFDNTAWHNFITHLKTQ